jgi:hypothetical protein
METGVAAATGAEARDAQGLHRMISTFISAGGVLCLFFFFYQTRPRRGGPSGRPRGAGVYTSSWTRVSFSVITIRGRISFVVLSFPLSLDNFSAFLVTVIAI